MEVIEVSGYDEVKEKVIDLFSRAKKSLWMSTSLYPEFYNDDAVKSALEGKISKLDFRLLLDRDVDVEKRKKEVPWIFRRAKSIRVATAKLPHWIIVDGKHFRLEKMHPHNKPGDKNIIVYDMDRIVGDILKEEFSEWWFNGKPVS